MTDYELYKKAEAYRLKLKNELIANDDFERFDEFDVNVRQSYTDGFNDGYSDGYEVGKKNERELQCGKKQLENLAKVNEALKAQIELMKCCENCADYDGTDCNADHEHDCKYFTGDKNDDDFWRLS